MGVHLARLAKYGLTLLLAAALLLAACDLYIGRAAAGRVYTDVGSVPPAEAALVPGTSKFAAPGRPNVYYLARLRGAAALFKAGKVRAVVVSGDNSTLRYNEPQRMREDLIDLGVPPENVACDYAGFRTLDSVARMREIFGFSRYIVVSQEFHAARALYLARAFGHDPVALVTSGDGGATAKVRLREVFARAVAFLDVNVFKSGPRFLGEPVKVTLAQPPADTAGEK